MILFDPLRARSAHAAERWICLSCRARQLRQSRSFFLDSASPYKSQQHPVRRRSPKIASRSRQFSTIEPRQAAPARHPRLPDSPARTRFAPSPTGYLHIGGLRTALFSYLLAKRTGGQFLLRIEDTDQRRLVNDAEARLRDDLNWAGLQWDEGPGVGGPNGPYRQSQRTQIYREHAQKLLTDGSAYRCFCTSQSTGGPADQTRFVTSGCYQNCSSLSAEVSQQRAEDGKEAFTVRLHQPHNAGKRVYPDLVYGKIQRLKRSPATPNTASEDDSSIDASDTILMKSDGTPTYHFANVIDDHLMKITHVIRGLEWMASTPLHYDIYSSFGWEPPQFAHVGLLVDQNKAKLSKRNLDLALDVASMRDEHGVLPDTLNNFLALLGWSNPTENDVMDMDELVQNFDLKFTRGNTMVRMEKLWFLQKQHVALRCERAWKTRTLHSIVDVVAQITAEVRRAYPDYIRGLENPQPDSIDNNALQQSSVAEAQAVFWAAILLADSKSFQNAKQFVERNRYFISRDQYHPPAEREYYNKAETIKPDHLARAAHAALDEYALIEKSDEIRDENHALELSSDAPDTADPFGLIAKEFEFHAVLAKQAWMAALNVDQHSDIPFDFPDLVVKYDTDLVPEVKVLGGPFDIEDTSRLIVEATKSREAGSKAEVYGDRESITERNVVDVEDAIAVKALANRYKVFYSALMRYIREKLCGGLPGPSMSVVMAILGRDECRERLCNQPRN